jgi:hypothetical protein
MEKLLKRFATDKDEIDYDALRARATYPDLIGIQVEADAHTPYFMKCACGMLVMTSRELALKETICANCHMNEELAATTGSAPDTRTLGKRGEGRMMFALVAFCAIAAGAIGSRVWDAPPRAQADAQVTLN